MAACYACDPSRTRGRRIREPPLAPITRTEFQRDRDRVVHSTAFRRLVYKTQVFVNHEGDLFRTRLTHSLEVAQLGRSIARSLALDEDLVEAISLAHDLGHTPFGHAGQDALNECMRDAGGFEHNLQSLRVVDRLEHRYPTFDGLNLCFETREGILKHCSASVAAALEAREPGGVAARFLSRQQPSLEAQLVNLADEIAYNAHDVDDGVRSGLLRLDQLASVSLIAEYRQQAIAAHPHLVDQPRRLLAETLRRVLSAQVNDVIEAARRQIEHHRPVSADAVRQLPPLICFGGAMREMSRELKRFLFTELYRHPQVTQTTECARDAVRALFRAYVADPGQLPVEQAADFATRGTRVVADYIAGMTDRFACREHLRLTGRLAFAPEKHPTSAGAF
jgi:dGTPase